MGDSEGQVGENDEDYLEGTYDPDGQERVSAEGGNEEGAEIGYGVQDDDGGEAVETTVSTAEEGSRADSQLFLRTCDRVVGCPIDEDGDSPVDASQHSASCRILCESFCCSRARRASDAPRAIAIARFPSIPMP